MRTLITIFAACFTLLSSAEASKTIDLRFTEARYQADNNSLYVDVEIRYNERGQMVLGGQNYRIYYNSQMLQLDIHNSKSNLPADSYSKLNVIDNVQGIDAEGVGQLSFDDNLGYVNVSIDLLDNKNGGVIVEGGQHSWMKVATLKFDVVDTDELIEVVWGRAGRSDEYATAFVEVSEWVQSYTTRAVNVNEYNDMALDMKRTLTNDIIDIAIGPNPTSDYLNVNFSSPVEKTTQVHLRDITGKVVRHQTLQPGMQELRLEVNNLAAANYFIEVFNSTEGRLLKEKVVVAN